MMFLRFLAKLLFAISLTGLSVFAMEFLPSSQARSLHYLSPLEEEIIDEINSARTHPRQYAAFLETTRPYYNGKRFERPREIPIVTHEGLEAVNEAIDFLRTVEPVAPLTPSKGLSFAARDHAADQTATGNVGHKGSDGSSAPDRVNRYGRWQKTIAENISYGAETARDVVRNQIIDDNVPNRGHRTTIFHPAFRSIGVSASRHPTRRTVTVMVFTAGYEEQSSAGRRRYLDIIASGYQDLRLLTIQGISTIKETICAKSDEGIFDNGKTTSYQHGPC